MSHSLLRARDCHANSICVTDVHFLKKPLVEKQGLEKVVAENGGLYAQRIFGPDEASHLGILIKERIVVGTDLNGSESLFILRRSTSKTRH